LFAGKRGMTRRALSTLSPFSPSVPALCQEAARALGISHPTADGYWVHAKTRLHCAILEPESEENT
jgi:hypothetical protein